METNSTLVIFALITALGLVMVVSIPPAAAQNPPIGLFGNPHDFRPGPPIPSCNAEFHQGPPDDTLKGCRDTP